MLVKASVKHIRMSPLKVRQVIDLIRGKDIQSAQAILLNIDKRAEDSVSKVLRSAVSNAQVKGFSPQQLYISKIAAQIGPMWKRYKAAAFGRATKIRRRTCHIVVELDLKGSRL